MNKISWGQSCNLEGIKATIKNTKAWSYLQPRVWLWIALGKYTSPLKPHAHLISSSFLFFFLSFFLFLLFSFFFLFLGFAQPER